MYRPTMRHNYALELCEKGYKLLPLKPQSKGPLIPWKKLVSTRREINQWFRLNPEINYGIIAGRSGVIILDADSPEAARWVDENAPKTPMQTQTPRMGRHFFYRDDRGYKPGVKIKGMELDVRAGMSYVVGSGCRNEVGEWRLVGDILSPTDLPVLPRGFLDAPKREAKPVSIPTVTRLQNYISRAVAVSGSNGHRTTFRVACKIADQVSNFEEAMAIFRGWNFTNAEPMWSESELQHKMTDAFRRER